MITHMHIENFKCFKDFDIDLGPFNVLIGPNDSGKTAFLTAVRLLGTVTGGACPPGRGRDWVWRGESGEILISATAEGTEGGIERKVGELRSRDGTNYGLREMPHPDDAPHPSAKFPPFGACVGPVGYYRLNPQALREPSLVVGKMDETGGGFPTFLADNLLADREAFRAMEKPFYARFPHYCGIVIKKRGVVVPLEPAQVGNVQIRHVEQLRKDAFVIAFKTREGVLLPAEAVSDGVMLSLAYIALGHAPEPPRVMLIEEPENGIHHASLKETIGTLHALATDKGVQVILTTHSPYLLDQVEPEEVRAFSKDKEGAVHARKLSDIDDVETMKKDFMTGEIWGILTEAQGI